MSKINANNPSRYGVTAYCGELIVIYLAVTAILQSWKDSGMFV